MVCICQQRLNPLALSLMPMASLNIPIPGIMAELTAALSAGMGSSSASASASAMVSLGLPGLFISASLALQIAATLNAAAQISAAFGIDLLAPDASIQLALAIGTFNFNFALLPELLSLNMSAVLSLSMALSTIASLRASLGIDLLLPGIALSLQAALAVGLPGLGLSAAAAVSATATASASASLNAALSLIGGIGNLWPTLKLLAQLQLPSINGNCMLGLINLSLLLQLSLSIQAVLGIDPFSISAALAIKLALAPLSLVASLSLQLALPMETASVSATASASATANAAMSALASLKLPNLLPFALVANLSAQLGLPSGVPCLFPCPLNTLPVPTASLQIG